MRDEQQAIDRALVIASETDDPVFVYRYPNDWDNRWDYAVTTDERYIDSDEFVAFDMRVVAVVEGDLIS